MSGKDETFGNIHLKHMCIAITTYPTSRSTFATSIIILATYL
jgi:hypothetical protein